MRAMSGKDRAPIVVRHGPEYFRAALTTLTRYKLRKVLKYGLVTVLVASAFTLYSGEMLGTALVVWSLLGLWTGVLEEFFFGRRFRALAIPLQLLGKALLLNLLTIAIIGLGFLIDAEGLLLLADEEPYRMHDLFLGMQFYRLVLRVAVVTTIAILVVQLEEMVGRRTFMGLLLGSFDRPKAEERIVLSIDLVGSTALAERLGDLRYYRFLNTVYSLMTDAVLRNEAEIHKYVGDEVIFTWPMRTGLRDCNCLDLYFDIMERIDAHAEELQRGFGAVPRYRGALHGGRVIAAQVGHIKRAIDLSGDVMNTVSRMLDVGKTRPPGLLIGHGLLERISAGKDRFRFGAKETVPVRGRVREVSVHTVERVPKGALSLRPAPVLASLLAATTLAGQMPVPITAANDRFVVFANGRFEKLEDRPPRATFPMEGRLAYLDHRGSLRLFMPKRRFLLQLEDQPTRVAASGTTLAWTKGDTLRTTFDDEPHTVAVGVVRFTVSDGSVAYQDRHRQGLYVMCGGREHRLRTVLEGDSAAWVHAGDAVVFSVHDSLFVWRGGEVRALVRGNDPAVCAVGGGALGWWDRADRRFKAMDHQGRVHELSSEKPVLVAAGDGLLAWVEEWGRLNCSHGDEVHEVAARGVTEFHVHDSLLVFVRGNALWVHGPAGTAQVERYIPEQWAVSGGMLVYLNTNRELWSMRAGVRSRIGREEGIARFTLYGDAVLYPGPAGLTTVVRNGRTYAF